MSFQENLSLPSLSCNGRLPRLNDQAKGGDVDILTETDTPLTLIERAQLKMALEAKLGLPVDITAQVRNTSPNPFQMIVRAHAVRLEAPP